jgi:maltodextrin utilization protein YvdJ
MDFYTRLFWMFFLIFVILSGYLLCCTKKSNMFYIQIASGLGMFVTSKIGRSFLGISKK